MAKQPWTETLKTMCQKNKLLPFKLIFFVRYFVIADKHNGKGAE
jgi:hypothetical protein